MTPVRGTCVPPQSSTLGPNFTTRTRRHTSRRRAPWHPALSPHRSAHCACPRRRCLPIIAFTSRSMAANSSGVTLAKWLMSKRKRSGATSEPFCSTCVPNACATRGAASAWRCGCVRQVALRLVSTCAWSGHRVLRQLLREMDDQLVLPLGIQHFHLFITVDQPALIADLSTAFGIERCAVQHDLVLVAAFAGNLAITQDACFTASAHRSPRIQSRPFPVRDVQSPVVTAVAARERSFCFFSSASKPLMSTSRPCSRAISCVRSIGNP
jgi:hypothetical protein